MTCDQCHYPHGDRPVRYPSGKTFCRRCAYPSDPAQWGEAWHEVRILPAGDSQRCACGEQLLAPISQQRGYCERCRLARQKAS